MTIPSYLHNQNLPDNSAVDLRITEKIVKTQFNSIQCELVWPHYWYVTHPPPTTQTIKINFLSNHWSDLDKIWNLTSGDQTNHFPLRSSSISVIFDYGHLPLWSSSITVIFHYGHLPLRSSSIMVIFHYVYHLPWQ